MIDHNPLLTAYLVFPYIRIIAGHVILIPNLTPAAWSNGVAVGNPGVMENYGQSRFAESEKEDA